MKCGALKQKLGIMPLRVKLWCLKAQSQNAVGVAEAGRDDIYEYTLKAYRILTYE